VAAADADLLWEKNTAECLTDKLKRIGRISDWRDLKFLHFKWWAFPFCLLELWDYPFLHDENLDIEIKICVKIIELDI
jgi:hypothetical protein